MQWSLKLAGSTAGSSTIEEGQRGKMQSRQTEGPWKQWHDPVEGATMRDTRTRCRYACNAGPKMLGSTFCTAFPGNLIGFESDDDAVDDP